MLTAQISLRIDLGLLTAFQSAMKKIYFNYAFETVYFYWGFILSLVFSLTACSENNDNSTNGAVVPTNLVIGTNIVGSSTTTPNGDGSGVVQFTVSAQNATSYRVLIGNQLIETTTGIFSHTFTQSGTNTYTITASAYNGSQFISASKSIIVYKAIQMIWSEEFNYSGAPDSSKWNYDIGNNGWGNNELQNYTNRPENVIVENGVLKIHTIKENYGGSNYTSARIKSQGKFSFKYGRVDIRAKLPEGVGTWPALWMLGENITTVNWPACGEIDIMEHLGSNLNQIHGSLHSPNNYGGNSNSGTTQITNATSEYHVYSVDWSAATIGFYVDDVMYFSHNNNASLPFNANFFLILNNAMGGWGGTVDPNFVSSTFEVDYIRIYQ